MMKRQSYSCVIVGSTTLVIECAKHLRAAGHVIQAVLPTDETVKAWAIREKLPLVPSIAELDELLASQSIEVLFSIVNPFLLTPSLLRHVRYAFNYHDAPLPRYAGTHATSWALLAHEKH